jgi:glycosyltransferase involved in cell wall biosynthesis
MTLPQSLAVLTDSNSLADRLNTSFGTDRSRFIAMPFSAAPHLEAMSADISASNPTAAEDGYFFYPAQFWPHKNHIRLLQALRILLDRGIKRDLVLSGGDRGMLAHIRAEAARLGVDDQVRILGFVPPEEMVTLYSEAAVVVVPTYFGPTNLPPLEAWTMRRPVVCSRVMAEQVGDAALIFDPDNPEELADAMAKALRSETAERLIRNGTRRIKELAGERSVAEAQLSKRLKSFARRSECWRNWQI